MYINGVVQPELYAQHVDPNMVASRDEFPVALGPQIGHDTAWVTLVESSLEAGEMVIPEGKSFVLGDNRNNSVDSRVVGLFTREQIGGEPLIILFSAEIESDSRNWKHVRWERLLKLL